VVAPYSYSFRSPVTVHPKQIVLVVFLLLSALLGGAAVLPASTPPQKATYVEPNLWSSQAETLSLIVTASDSHTAADLVEQLGGQVSSELWLIDAVAARLPVNQLEALAAAPGIVSIVTNKSVETADQPGWVTERRIQRGRHELSGSQLTPPVALLDGGFFSITDGGNGLILNADGHQRIQFALNGTFKTSPKVGADGTIYIASEAHRVYAIQPDGTVSWEFSDGGSAKFRGGVTLGPAGTVYVTDEDRHIFAIDPATGQQLWQYFAATGDGDFLTAPAAGPDGTVYAVTEKGYIFAVDANGLERWSFRASMNKDFKLNPQVGVDGTLYVSSIEKRVYALNPNGSLKYEFVAPDKVTHAPLVGADGSVYVPATDYLVGLNPDGTTRFSTAGAFLQTPIAVGETAVLVAVAGETVFGFDSVTGVELWQHPLLDKIVASPSVDAEGNVVIGSEGKDLVGLSSNGDVIYRLMLDDKITQSVSPSTAGTMAVRVGTSDLAVAGRMPEEYDGRPDVLPNDGCEMSNPSRECLQWKVVSPVAIDSGADVLHDQGLTGEGITIAVVDSGVFFNEFLSKVDERIGFIGFIGQADFVGDGVCQGAGTQYNDARNDPLYCFTTTDGSVDPYGHGSHVAGIVNDSFTDVATSVPLGIAPDSDILSVRVLGEDGFGTYEDVIQGIQFVVAHKDQFNVRVMNLSLSANPTSPYFADPFNRAVEAAWANGIVVVAAAGNSGPGAESVTVPGNDPYVISVGAVDSNRTAGYWANDILPGWSATGPTLDGFAKPDVLAPGSNIVSWMHPDLEPTGN
jgi:outer membrane protein assembly factor BamB